MLRFTRRHLSSQPQALPVARNIWSSRFKRTLPLYTHLCAQLRLNAELPIKLGPSNAFHNHNAAHLTATFRLGGSKEHMLKILKQDPARVKLDADDNGRTTLTLDTENWRDHLGGFGLFGLGVEHHYWAYRRFFLTEISRLGPDATLRTYYAPLAQGLAGDFFHAIIELGYYFESGKATVEVLANSLAWLAAAYVDFPKSNTVKPMRGATPMQALARLAATQGLPSFDLNDGSSGYIRATEILATKHLDQVLRCEVDLSDVDNVDKVLMGMVGAGLESFAAGLENGINDFYLLHILTGSRAVWALLNSVGDWGNREATLMVQKATLGALWRAILFTHAARNNRSLKPRVRVHECRPWLQITAWALETDNSHIAKVIMTCADFYDRTGDSRFWEVADMVMTNREGGGKLVGTGVGSRMDIFLARVQV